MKTKALLLLMLVTFIGYGQKSPAETAEGTVDGVHITIDYGSPRVNGRTIYGNLVPYGKIWRAGANKNTTIKFDKEVSIEGKKIPAGKYGFFIIPNENGSWTAIFNKKNDGWGAYDYKESDDALRLDVEAHNTDENKEELMFKVTEDAIKFAWADKYLKLKLK
ncbi:DUF2911 domain-containing protein [Urechidicola croceus]|uniref:Asparagine synthetase B n=1 Tax=Urechidicola croceus TaxID=1850246 RepID=A0A1D8P683_9FLAO|nr:DUF2911 domain-containing protein [Urechidicola croceus]AOW20057.1 hypothetical protein LPB138_04885 [Urechidicola croceus]